MRATDDRYRGEQARFELAMRMIKHEARTGTIRYLDRASTTIAFASSTRRISSTATMPVRRRRGRSPTRIGPLVRTPTRALESGVFANLLLANGLFSHRAVRRARASKATSISAIASASASRAYDMLVPRGIRCRSNGAGTCSRAFGAATSSVSRAATTCSRLLRVRPAVAAALRLPGLPAVRARARGTHSSGCPREV